MTEAPDMSAVWQGMLTGTDPRYRRNRRFLKHVPGTPRCLFCAAPFGGPFAPIVRATGRRPWGRNPRYCAQCFHTLEALHGGAEIDCSVLFADIRGSTALAEAMPLGDFQRLMTRFYRVATQVLVEQDAIIDKFVGDEVVSLFIPAMVQDAHPARAVEAARKLLEATGHRDVGGPWLPVGVGISSGVAYVGSIGEGEHVEFTALGDIVNVAARLAGVAAGGEILLTMPALERAHVPMDHLERRRLDLKGKSAETEVAVLSVRG
jgi:adenylate cyclase